MASAPSTVDWIATHRAQWGRKAGLRIVYESYFRRLREGCVPDTPILELGCGPGFFKERYPEVIATDVVNNPRADAIIDAAALPFGTTSSSIGCACRSVWFDETRSRLFPGCSAVGSSRSTCSPLVCTGSPRRWIACSPPSHG